MTVASITERRKKDGSVSFRVQVRVKGHEPVFATFARKTDARHFVQDTEAAMRNGRLNGGGEARRRTIADLVDEYIAKLPLLKLKGVADQKRQLRWWKAELGDRRLVDVTPGVLSEMRDKLMKAGPSGKPCTAATVNRYLASLSSAYSMAVKEWGWVSENPVRNVRKPPEPRGRTRYLSDDERDRLLKACRGSSNRFLYPIVVLALSTGMRRGEIMNLKWSDIDFERERIVVRETKNGEVRVLPLPREVENQLRFRTRNENVSPHIDFVFPSERRRGFGRFRDVRPMNIQKAWEKALEKAEINDFRFHDLRHSAASYFAMNGATPIDIAAVLGHKTLAMVKRYGHLSEAHTARVVQSMNAKIFPDTEESVTETADEENPAEQAAISRNDEPLPRQPEEEHS